MNFTALYNENDPELKFMLITACRNTVEILSWAHHEHIEQNILDIYSQAATTY